MIDAARLLEGPKLTPGEAAAALLVTPDGRYLMQHRDDKPEVFFAGWWGTFGGALEPGERPEEAMRRELIEELAFDPPEMQAFCTLGLDFGFAGRGVVPRHFFEIPIHAADVDAMVLGEGQDLGLFPGPDLLTMRNVIPYDATAIWQHLSRNRF